MVNRDKLKKVLGAMSSFDDNVKGTFADVDRAMAATVESLKQGITAKTLQETSDQFKKLQDLFRHLPTAYEALRSGLIERATELQTTLDNKFAELDTLSAHDKSVGKERYDGLTSEIATLQKQLTEVAQRKIEFPDFQTPLKDLEARLSGEDGTLGQALQKLRDDFEAEEKSDVLKKDFQGGMTTLQTQAAGLANEVADLRRKLSSLGGGSMNRQFFVGGNDALSKYSDINLKAGANVTLTFANNNNTKKAEITIASSGGGGSTRSINSISVDTAAGSTVGTDYVYLCSGTLILTLPDATSNTNLYTVKNVGAGVVTIATSSAQTIDGNATIQMATQFTAVDVISDSSNWNIT